MSRPKKFLSLAAVLALAMSAVACGDESSTGGGLSGGGSGGTGTAAGGSGGTGGKGGSGGSGGAGGGGPACTVTDLATPTCAACVGGAVLACPVVAFGCFSSSGPLQTCVEDAGCLDGDVDAGCILANCGMEFLAVNACMGACPQYVACFR